MDGEDGGFFDAMWLRAGAFVSGGGAGRDAVEGRRPGVAVGDGEFMVEQFMFAGHRPGVAPVAELPGPGDMFRVGRVRCGGEFGPVGPAVDERLDVVVDVDGHAADGDPFHGEGVCLPRR